MALLPPRVKGPLSECSSRVRVEATVTGATVEVLVAGAIVGSGTATGPAITVVVGGGALPPGDEVRARQQIGVDISASSPDPVVVQAKPPDIGPVGFRSHLHVCGECLWLEGLVPGAKVEVHGNAGLLGTAESYDGNARVGLSSGVQAGDTITAQQEACGEAGVPTEGPAPDFPGGDQGVRLDAPSVESPLRSCQRSVVVSDVYEGASVTLLRSGGPNLVACFDASALRFRVNPGLVEGETVSARQEFLECESFSDIADPVIVGPAEPVPVPVVVGPLCAEGTSVRLSGLLYGSRVRIFQAGIEIGTAESPEEGTYDFPVPPLAPPSHHGGGVTAQQELCGIWSDLSEEVPVDPKPEEIPTPEVAEPLFECAAAVLVRNVRLGSRVYVESAMLGAPIGEVQAYDTEVLVPVAPLLAVGDEITAFQLGCGLRSERSDPVEVRPLEELGTPVVEDPLYACDRPVVVTGAVPGARVEVYVNGVYRGAATAGEDRVEVSVTGSLEVGDAVQARQRLCELVSDLGNRVVVEKFDGRWFSVGNEDVAQILAVHAALLHTGKILYFGGDQHTSSLNANGDVDHTRLFDCDSFAIDPIGGLPASADLFCAGHCQLADGRVLVGGGTHKWRPGSDEDPHGHGGLSHFIGSRESWVFEANGPAPADHRWRRTGELVTQRPTDPDLNTTDISRTGGKWYPTLVTLPDGRAIAVSGHSREFDSRHNNDTLERFDPATDSWNYVGPDDVSIIPRSVGRTREYPRLTVLPGGTVLSSSELAAGKLHSWTIGDDANTWVEITSPRSGYGGNPLYQTSVLLPLRPESEYRARVLMAGKTAAWVLDPAASTKWTATTRVLSAHPDASDMNPERNNLDAVILPTGEVLVEGGAKDIFNDATGVKKAEMFDPEVGGDSGTWRVLPAAEETRNYHSVALLMPNGAVWVAGSNVNSGTGLGNRNLTIEIFEPWYFCHTRPRISSAPSSVCVGDDFEVWTPDGDEVKQVVLVRAGSCTHNFNPDQRLIECSFEQVNPTVLQVQAPPDASIAPPGYYLLFVLTADRVPSKGQFIKVCPARRRLTLPDPRDPLLIDRDLLDLIRRIDWLGVGLRSTLTSHRLERPDDDDDDTLAIIRARYRAVNAHDLRGFGALYADAVVWDDPGLAKPVSGPAAVVDRLESWIEAFPDLRWDLQELMIDGEAVCARFRFTGHHEGKLKLVDRVLEPTRRAVSINGIGVYRVAGGRIIESTILFDTSALAGDKG